MTRLIAEPIIPMTSMDNPPSGEYQRARINLFVNPVHRHQIDALASEWNCPLTEALRRVIAWGLRGILLDETSQLPIQ